MLRVVKPELLDELPHDHPDARRSRRELRLINFLMGAHRWHARQLARELRPGDRILELGAGGGDLWRAFRQKHRQTPGVKYHAIDQCPPPPDWPPAVPWWRQDLLRFENYDQYDIVVCNLILHHFSAPELATLGQILSRGPRLLLACEPARKPLHLRQIAALSACGLGRVTRHDARVSIEAGFLGDELPQLLGLPTQAWSYRCATGWRGQYKCIARRAP